MTSVVAMSRVLGAAPARPQALFSDVLPWAAVLLGLVVAGLIVIVVARRSMREPGGAGGFTLQDLREMHAAGELTDEEFERARSSLIERMQRRAAASAPNAGGKQQGPGNRTPGAA